MDLDNLGKAWDVSWVRRDCWSSCEKGYNSKYARRVDEDKFPVYRDPETLSGFLSSARQFECTNVCENDYFYKRLVVALPSAFAGLLFVLVCVSCYFCKGCVINKIWKRKGSKDRLAESASSLTLSTATTISVIENLKNEVDGGNRISASNSKSWVIDDRDGGGKQQGRSEKPAAKKILQFGRRRSNDDKYKKPWKGKRGTNGMNSSTTSPSTSSVQTMRDMKGESMRSATSINSWMEESANGKEAKRPNKGGTLSSTTGNRPAENQLRKPSKSLLNTTARLGRRLIALDLESEGKTKSLKVKKQPRHRKSSN